VIENFRIRVFRAVARQLNFSRAAEKLFLTQPAVTQQIKALEEELRVPLFYRTGGHISLTPGGKALLPIAEKMKALSEEAVLAVAEAYCPGAPKNYLTTKKISPPALNFCPPGTGELNSNY
jgi:DNA-binding transcriptional LysR family regulator